MSDAIDPIEELKKGASASTNLHAMMAHMLLIRENSVLKDQTRQTEPMESVGATSEDAMLAAASRIARMSRMVQQQHTIQEAGSQQTEGQAQKSLQADKEKDRQNREMDGIREVDNEDAAVARQFHSGEQEASAGFAGSRHQDRLAAFLKARGYERLKQAGSNPIMVKDTLDALADEADIEPDTAANLYHGIVAQYKNFNSEAALAELFAKRNAFSARRQEAREKPSTPPAASASQPAPVGPMRLAPVLGVADDMPCYFTPVKT